MRINPRILTLSIVALAMATAAGAQVLVTLPDESQSSTLTVTVSEQATVTVPATITFAVTDIAATTPAAASPITVTGILLATGTKQLKISIKAATASFTGSGTTYSASDVTWGTGASWTNATETTGTLSTSYQELATADAGVSSASTADAKFSLSAQPVTSAGSKTLVLNYKFESIGA